MTETEAALYTQVGVSVAISFCCKIVDGLFKKSLNIILFQFAEQMFQKRNYFAAGKRMIEYFEFFWGKFSPQLIYVILAFASTLHCRDRVFVEKQKRAHERYYIYTNDYQFFQ